MRADGLLGGFRGFDGGHNVLEKHTLWFLLEKCINE
jgi:hypothetical protein